MAEADPEQGHLALGARGRLQRGEGLAGRNPVGQAVVPHEGFGRDFARDELGADERFFVRAALVAGLGIDEIPIGHGPISG